MRAALLRLPTLIPTAADRDLLRRFADARDEGAFAELVRRHGPLVLAVCRRVVSDSHLADDAFQATFVVLARKAATAGVGARLSTWLHSVAVKVSLRARTMAGRRAKRETLTATVPDVPDKSSGGTGFPACADETAVLDEEIDRLPEALRAAVVLCELRGVGRRDAAKELGIAEGTLSSRLAAARKKLAERLRARGVAPAAAIFPAIFVPTDLAAAAVAVSTGSVELGPHLAHLVEGGMQMTLLTKLKLAAVAVAVAVLAVGGFGGKWGNESAAAPVPKDLADAGIIWMFHPAEGQLVGYAPDGKKARTVKFAAGGTNPGTFFGITRDGQHALLAAAKGTPPKDGKAGHDELSAGKLTVHLWPLHGDAKPTDTGIKCEHGNRYVIARGGKSLVVESHRAIPDDPIPGADARPELETVAYDLTTFKGTERPVLAAQFWLVEELANGDRLVAFGQYGSDKRPLQSFHLLAVGSDKPKLLTGEDETDYCAPSPDGATLLVTRQFSSKSQPADSFHRMYLLGRASGKAEPFAHRDNTQHAHGHWSPDGTRVVYEWLEEGPQIQERILGGGLQTVPISRAQVVVTDASGKTEKVILDLDGCPETDVAKAQTWHAARPKLVGWYPTRRPNVPVPKAKAAEPLVAVWQGDDVRVLTLDGKELHKLAFKEWADRGGGFIRLSPDGKRIAVRLSDKAAGWQLVIATLGSNKPDLVADLEQTGDGLFWSPDGKSVSCGEGDKLVTVDIATGRQTKVEPEHATRVYGVTADGRHLAEYLAFDDTLQPTRKLGFLNGKFSEFKPFIDLSRTDVGVQASAVRSPVGVSADGSVAAFARVVRDKNRQTNSNVVEWIDVAKGDRTELLTLPDWEITPSKLAMAPNGEWVVVGYQEREAVPPGQFAKSLGFTLALYDRTTGKPTLLLERDEGRIKAVDVWTPTQKVKAPVPKAVAPPPKKNAPVPVPPKENSMGLTASVTLDKKEVMLGEPMYFTFAVANPTDAAWQFEEGGDYRNRLGRPNSFAVAVTGPDGKAVPQPDSGMDMGGISTLVKLPADGSAAFRPLFLPHWATFDKPGEYTVTVKRRVGLVPADAEDGFRAKATPVNLSATAKITVTPTDAKRMGALIDELAADMLDPKSPESDRATKKLLAIRDPRVIPHFIELGKRPRLEARYAACEALGKFNTDEAFAALKALYATTGADLKGSAINAQLEESSANGVRHAAIGAILDCGHPDALAFGWKTAIDDGYDGVRMTVLHKAYEVKSPAARKVIAALLTDADDRIRGEAKRYTELLAKAKK